MKPTFGLKLAFGVSSNFELIFELLKHNWFRNDANKDFIHFISIYQFFFERSVRIIIFGFYEEKYIKMCKNNDPQAITKSLKSFPSFLFINYFFDKLLNMYNILINHSWSISLWLKIMIIPHVRGFYPITWV